MSDYLDQGFDANLSKNLGESSSKTANSSQIRNPITIDTENAVGAGSGSNIQVLKLVKTLHSEQPFPVSGPWNNFTVGHGLNGTPAMVTGKWRVKSGTGSGTASAFEGPWLDMPWILRGGSFSVSGVLSFGHYSRVMVEKVDGNNIYIDVDVEYTSALGGGSFTMEMEFLLFQVTTL